MQRGKFYIGIDWATEKHALCITDAEGHIVKERSIPNDTGLFECLFAQIAETPPNEVFVAVETRRLVLVEALLARGFRIFTINPKQSERFRDRFSVAGAKDDRFDARVLASALRTDLNLFRAVESESRPQIRLRAATRMEQTVKEQLREVANRLRDVVMSSMPLLLRLCNGADESWFWDLVLLAPAPDAAKLIPDEEPKQLLKRHRIHRPSADEFMDYSHPEGVRIHRPSADEFMDYSHPEGCEFAASKSAPCETSSIALTWPLRSVSARVRLGKPASSSHS